MRRLTACLFGLLVACALGCSHSDSTKDAANDEAKRQADIAQLQSLGYVGGYRAPKKDEEKIAARTSQMAPGYTLITSGHAPTALLIDSEGKTIHSWSYEFEKIFPDYKVPPKDSKRDLTGYWRSAALLPGGDLLAIFEGLALVKLDKNSKVVWAKLNNAHHDLEVMPDGRIMVLTRKVEVRNGKAVVVDYLSFLDANGNEQSNISLLDAVLKSPLTVSLLRGKRIAGDMLHSNSVQSLKENAVGSLPGIVPGDVLVSMRNLSLLGIVRPSTGELLWSHSDIYKEQHFARITPDGKELLLFDNIGNGKRSRVLRYPWPQMTLPQEIDSRILKTPFFSRTLGTEQLLPNGNLLIAESEGGRVFELNPAGEIVWKFVSPYRTGKRNRLIATIPHAVRVQADEVDPWLK